MTTVPPLPPDEQPRAKGGRKLRYGEPTKIVRLPVSQADVIREFLTGQAKREHSSGVDGPRRVATTGNGMTIPVIGSRVPAGFPSPAEDYIEHRTDLNEHLVSHPDATYVVHVSGSSMIGAGIHDGDDLIVDRAMEPHDGAIVIAVIEGELTVKRLSRSRGVVTLVAENPDYPDLTVSGEDALVIWGVVTYILHKAH